MAEVKAGFDWADLQKITETVLGKSSFFLDQNRNNALLAKDGKLLAVVSHLNQDRVVLAMRVSILPNIAIMLATAICQKFIVELDPHFEFDDNGEMVFGIQATRAFADNAKLLLLNERSPSPGSLVVKPKGSYTKHRFN